MIFITGCARSGSSLVAGMVARCGAFGGDVSGESRWCPKGQYENLEVRTKVIKPILKLLKADPMAQKPLPDMHKIKSMLNGFPAQVRSNIDSIIKKQGIREPWYIKEPKICIIWPIWMRAYPEAHYIITSRPDELIIQSCIRTSFMRKRSTVAEWQEWIDFHKRRFMEMAVFRPNNVHVISTLDIVNGKYEAIKKTIELIGLEWNEAAIDFVDRKIWNTVK